jgi:hypothetical protein
MRTKPKRPFGLRGVPHYKQNERFANPHKMTKSQLDEAWGQAMRNTDGPIGDKDKEWWHNLSRLEYEIRKRGGK